MEKIEFIAGTGLSFFSPQREIVFDENLFKTPFDFRLLKSSRGMISIQLGADPHQAIVTADGDEMVDIGKISIRFQDVLNTCLRKWIPLPYTRKTADRSTPSRSNDWIRLWFNKPAFSSDDLHYQMVLAADTTVSPPLPPNTPVTDSLGFFADDIGLWFEANAGASSFWQSSTLRTWVQALFKNTPAEGVDASSTPAVAWAAFTTLIEGFRSSKVLPEVALMNPDGQDIDVHLVLDLGNSRACGILADSEPKKQIQLDECTKLEIRDLSDPTIVYSEPFDTSFKFCPPLFSDNDSENPIPHAGSNFRWPSVLRLGREAAKMDPSDVGDTGMSSPKRYLWDDTAHAYPWFFNTPEAKKISAPFFRYLNEAGLFQGENAQPSFDNCYAPSVMMTFLILEILCHAHAQINSPGFRAFRGRKTARRRLKSFVITTPCGMSVPEKMVYRKRVETALDLYYHYCGLPAAERPELILDFDEATCVQLTYLFGEIKDRFNGDAKEAITTLGRERDNSSGQPTYRVASIDVGGGTTDLMIAEYRYSGHDVSGIQQTMLFSEGFSVAGDEMAKRVIQKIILKRVFDYAQERNPSLRKEQFNAFFGPSKSGRSKEFLDRKAELCRQIWLPMAHRHLEFAERDSGESSIEMVFEDFFEGLRRPGSSILDFFADNMKREFGSDFTIADIPWVLSKRQINRVVENVLEPIMRIFSEVIALYDCDLIVLGGKPSSLPVVRDLLVRFMAVAPESIIGLKGYPVGHWYPFSNKFGGIADPKTACVVGAAVWLFAENLNNLDGLSLKTDFSRILSQECFMGPFSPEVLTLAQPQQLFPSNDKGEAKLTMTKNVKLGSRRINSELCTINPIWEVMLPDLANLKSEGPYQVTLKQDPKNKEMLAISKVEDEKKKTLDIKTAVIRLRTMVDDKYWLDTGSFDLG